jgi:hypothetical protein
MAVFTKPPELVDGNTAYASDVNVLADATETAFELVEDELVDHILEAEGWALVAEQWATEVEDEEVDTGKYSSLHYAAKSEDFSLVSKDYRDEAETLLAGVYTAIAADPWEALTSYDYPDAVIGSDGNPYRCIGTAVVGDDPVSSTSGDWVQLNLVTAPTPEVKTADFTAVSGGL